MNRQREYRAWHRVQKVMLHEDKPGDVFRWLHEGQPIDIMDCTGKLDRNGAKIFEGDTVSFQHGQYLIRAAIIWDNKLTGFYAVFNLRGGGPHYRAISKLEAVEVIGNKYEHRELLREQR